MNSAPNLIEKPTDMIMAFIKANIAEALTEIRNERGNYVVSTEPPPTQSYFIYEGAMAYQAPGVFVVAQKNQTRLDRGQSFTNSQARYCISVVVEDKEKELLSRKSWRYQDALYGMLHETEIRDDVSPITKIAIKVIEQRFSNNFASGNEQQKTFRKEVAFDCDVEIWQGL
jgi:hypothetical protein